MMHEFNFDHAQLVLSRVAPGSRLVSMDSAIGGFTNDVRILECRTPDGNITHLVVKFLIDQPEYSTRAAVAHYHALNLAREHEIPVPEPIYLDETGDLLGAPGLIMRFISGKQVADPIDPRSWAQHQAQMLLKIHSIRPGKDYMDKLFDGNQQTLFFLDGDLPARLSGHPLSADLFRAVRDLKSTLIPAAPVLVHLDFWHGNVLWENDSISAIVDWDFAGYGEPAIDVAFFRMNMYLRGIKQAADIFLDEYERGSGNKVKNLGFRELTAAAQPLPNPIAWTPAHAEMGGKPVTEEDAQANYEEFVTRAIDRAYSGN